jgi:Leucine-rich repeat (LRR) protein
MDYSSSLKNLPELELLVIEYGRGFDIGWESLPKLRKLALGNCELMEPSKMSSLTNLEILSLRRQDFITVDHLKNMKKLTHLDLVCNKKISEEILSLLPNLRFIGLGTGSLIPFTRVIMNPRGIELIDYGENEAKPREPTTLINHGPWEKAVPLKYCCGLFKHIFQEPFR